MHELSIALSIVDAVSETARVEKAKKVNGFILEVGTFSGVETEALQFSLESALKNSEISDAVWEVRQVEGKGKCSGCQNVFPVDEVYACCPHCQKFGIEIIQGHELKIKSIDIEV